MRLRRRWPLCLLALLAGVQSIFSAPVEIRDGDTDIRLIAPYYLKTRGSVPPETVLKLPFAATTTAQIALADNEAAWLRTEVLNRSNSEQRLALRHEFPWTDRVDFFLIDAAGKILARSQGGDRVPGRRSAPISVIHFSIQPQQALMLLVRIETVVQAGTQLHLLSPAALENHLFIESAVQGLFAGIVLMLLLFHANLYAATRDKTIGRYIAYLAAIGFFIPLRSGVLQQYFFGEYAQFGDTLWPFLVSAAYYSAVRFARSFLSLSMAMPVTDRLLGYLQIVCITPLLALLIGRRESFIVENAVGILTGPPLLALGIYCAWRNRKQALYFVLGYSLPIAAAIGDNLVENGILPVFAGRNEMLPVAIAAEFLLFAIVLYGKLSDIEFERTLDNERLLRLERELAFARIVQQSLLPRAKQQIGNMTIDAISTTQNAVGGDYFDIVEAGNGFTHLLLIDAGGSGKTAFLTAALDASASRMAFRNGLAEAGDMQGVLRRMFALLGPALGTRHIALTYCVVNCTDGTCRLAVIDNPPPVLVTGNKPRTAIITPAPTDDLPQIVKLQLAPGDSLCLTTRGIQRRVNLLRDRLPPRERVELLRRESEREHENKKRPSIQHSMPKAAKDMTLIVLNYAGNAT